MKTIYDIIKENPEIVKGKKYLDSDLAVANYLITMSVRLGESEVTEDGAWVHTHSRYDELVDKIIKSSPRAVELIMSLKDGVVFIGGIDSQLVYLLVDDYLNGNFEKKNRRRL